MPMSDKILSFCIYQGMSRQHDVYQTGLPGLQQLLGSLLSAEPSGDPGPCSVPRWARAIGSNWTWDLFLLLTARDSSPIPSREKASSTSGMPSLTFLGSPRRMRCQSVSVHHFRANSLRVADHQ